MKISNLDIMEVDVEVNESDIISVEMGNKAEIEVDAYLGHTFIGIVTEIGNTALNASSNGFNLDQVTNFSVKIRIDSSSYSELLDSNAPFRPGMSATVNIQTNSVYDALSLPIQCVTTRNDTIGVFVYDDGVVVWTPIEIGIQDNQRIEIASALTESTTVVSGPYDMVARKLSDGDVVSSGSMENEGQSKKSMRIQ